MELITVRVRSAHEAPAKKETPGITQTPRYYPSRVSLWDGIVVPIGGQRWKITKNRIDDNDTGIPKPSDYEIIFEMTNEPETPFMEWTPKYINEDVEERCPYRTVFFGQPHFNQNEIYPVVEGSWTYPLFTHFTEWGDSGNENFWVTLDPAGIPTHVWFEASCC